MNKPKKPIRQIQPYEIERAEHEYRRKALPFQIMLDKAMSLVPPKGYITNEGTMFEPPHSYVADNITKWLDHIKESVKIKLEQGEFR